MFTFSPITMVTALITYNWNVVTFDPLTWRNKTSNMATRAEAAASPEDKDGTSNSTSSSPPQSKKLNRGVQVLALFPGLSPHEGGGGSLVQSFNRVLGSQPRVVSSIPIRASLL